MKFLFFDLDGTLADTDPDIRGSWKAAIAELGLDCPRFDELFIAGPPFDEMTKVLFPEIFTQALADSIRALFAKHYDGDGFPLTREYPGVIDVVRAAKTKGARAFVVTNKRYAGTLALARHFGWLDVFEGFYAGDMHRGDPIGVLAKPALLKRVMDEVGARPEESLMIGDTRHDFEAGRVNGVRTIAVSWGYGRPDDFSLADRVIHSAADLALAVS